MGVEVIDVVNVSAKRHEHVPTDMPGVLVQVIDAIGFKEMVFSHEQIQVRVVVDIHPKCTPAIAVHFQFVILGGLLEGPRFGTDEKFRAKTITSEGGVGQKEVLVCVLVKVSQGGCHAVDDEVSTVFRRDVQEGAISLILEQRIGSVFVVDHENILPPIAVVIPPDALKTQPQMNVHA
jgi:hypothetical protein